MPFKKGQSGNPAGRRKGASNKATKDVRQMIARMAEAKADEFTDWLDRVAKDDPAKAADLFLKAIEYHIPKLARTEIGTDQDQPPRFEIVAPWMTDAIQRRNS